MLPDLTSFSALLTLATNAISIFASVSFAAGAAAGFIANMLKWQERVLLKALTDMLNDKDWDGLARQLYVSANVNPLGPTEDEVKPGTTPKLSAGYLDPQVFGAAILQVLNVVPTALLPDEKTAANAEPKDFAIGDRNANSIRVEPILVRRVDAGAGESQVWNAKANARSVIQYYVKKPEGQRQLIELVYEMIDATKLDQTKMQEMVAAWYNRAMTQVRENFKDRIQITTFLIALLIAAVLNLKPIPFGGFGAAASGTTSPASLTYLIAGLNWTVVALASLSGSEYWYNLLKWATRRS